MGSMHKNTTNTGLGNLTTASESVIYTTPAFSIGPGMTGVRITGTVNITPGTAATAITIRVRQGSLTGPLVSPAAAHTVVAGAAQSISFGATDTTEFTEQAGGGAYVITGQQTSASANGTANLMDVEVAV